MAKTLLQIQNLVIFNARDSGINITSGQGRHVANRIYRDMCMLFPWSELRVEDTITCGLTGVENWILTTMADIRSIEWSDSVNTVKKLIFPPEDEFTWNRSALPAGIPDYYMKHYDSGNKIELRPTPSVTSGTITVTGIKEPTELAESATLTIFEKDSANDILAHLIAADYAGNAGDLQLEQNQVQKAVQLLKKIFRNEEITFETVANGIG